VSISWVAAVLSIEGGVHFRACFAYSWFAAVLSIFATLAALSECVHFRACFTDSCVAAVLSIEGVHFRDCFADSWCPFQGVIRIFVGRGGTVHRGWCSFQGVLRIFVVRGGTILVVVHTYPRQPLASLSLEGVHFRACFADSWVAESAHSVSRRYYPLIGRSPGVPLLRVLLVSCRGLCYLLAQAQALERSYLRVRPGGLSTANT
jgi:hypothetical protein